MRSVVDDEKEAQCMKDIDRFCMGLLRASVVQSSFVDAAAPNIKEFLARIRKETATWKKVVADARLTVSDQ